MKYDKYACTLYLDLLTRIRFYFYISQHTITDLPDILICGNCKDLFTTLTDIIDHKKNYCKLRFACKCGPPNNNLLPHQPQLQSKPLLSSQTVSLLCSSCEKGFSDPMDLMVHVQAEHSVNIFEEEIHEIRNEA